MESGSGVVGDPKVLQGLRPPLTRELRSTVRNDLIGNTVSGNPKTQQSITAGGCGRVYQRYCLWPAGKSVHKGE